ncbi:MAG: hypothetical protein ACRDRA_10110 [Pseudonocardiaceae bacterium]
MSSLEQATLTRLTTRKGSSGQPDTVQREEPPPKGSASPIPPTVTVQFNPTSLRVTYQNNPDSGGVTAKAQRRQYGSAQPATLSVDLEFDTAEEQLVSQDTGAASRAVDVRTKTAMVRQFVEPPADNPSAAPPRVQFQWGTLIFNGIVTQVIEELDYFASDGTPLRAKLSVSITEQNLKFEGNASGPGARTDRAAIGPGAPGQSPATPGNAGTPAIDPPPGPGPGRSGTRAVERVLSAVVGESVQQLATRAGGNPAAWRSLMNGLQNPLGIPAGTPVVIGPELDTFTTPGRAAGFAAGAAVSAVEELAQVLGLAPEQGPPGGLLGGQSGAAAAEAAGFALSAAGGVAAATTEVLIGQAGREVVVARGSFAPSPSPAVPVAADGVLDPRAVTFGRAIPLRARVYLPTVADLEAGGRRSLAARARPVELPVATAPTTAPWEQLPIVAGERGAADSAQRNRDARPRTIRWRPGGECS